MKFSLFLSAFALLAPTLLSGNPAKAQTYTYIDLGNVWVSSINNAGQITGWINPSMTFNGPQGVLITPLDTNGDGKPDTWYKDVSPADGVNDLMTVLPIPPGHTGSLARAINAAGEIAGETRGTTGNNQVAQQAFFTGADASVSEIVNSRQSYASGINDSGVLAGWAYTNTGRVYSTTWKKTVTRKGTTWTATSLGAPSGYTSTRSWGAQSINNDGAVAARTEGNAIVPLVWLPSALYGLPQGWTVLPGLNGAGGDSRAINSNSGGSVQLAGYSNGHAVLWTLAGGSVTILDLHPTQPELAAFIQSFAYGLNNAPNGVLSVVGMIDNQVSATRPFLWRSDTQQSIVLNDYITEGLPAGLVPWSATAVNDFGVIIGYGVPNGDPALLNQQRGFVLIPNP